ncbi:MAG: hypothetical protein BM485_03065 [Desulfobulbaceae bacterium DB1]|nr:MAG: hypothetical protein BM485_03065 [Desulfobulbaceae bacterium DB1]
MNVLGVGAHFDDLELGCGGTLINHARAGDRVTMLVITHSGYVDPDGNVIRKRETALAEGLKAAGIIGADLICLEYPTLEISFDEALTKRIQQIIEGRQIDTIYSHWEGDLHRDHKLTAQSTLMAGRHAPRFLMYRSNYYVTGQPFGGNFYVNISDVIEEKREAIRAHASEMERVNYSWLDFVERQDANHGLIIGVRYAEQFKVVRYLL